MPTNEEIYDEASRLKDQGENEAAIAKLHELLVQDEKYALAHSALAVLYTRVKQHDLAIKHAQRVCELEPNEAFSYTAMSVTCQRAGKIQEAEDAMARARMIQGH